MHSEHPIHERLAHFIKIRGKIFFCKKQYILRFGSKTMFQDLIDLGLTPRKSLRLKLPIIPNKLVRYFIRGYFDGDGCIYLYRRSKTNTMAQVIFTSGCKSFLIDLSRKLSGFLNINEHKALHSKNGAYQLRYKKNDTIRILKFMYKNLNSAPYLERKYLISKPYLNI